MTLMQIPLSSISNRRHRYHDLLTEQQSDELRSIYKDFGRLIGDETFEEFERDFLFERNVDAEIRHWSRMADAFCRCMKRFPTTDKVAATAVIVSLSLGEHVFPVSLPRRSGSSASTFRQGRYRS